MQSSQRAIVGLVLAGTLIPATSAARTIAAPRTRNCAALFTVHMGQRAALAIYSGTKKVGLRKLRLLGYLERCQRNPMAQRYVRWYDHHQASLWKARRYPSITATPASALASCIIQHESGGNPQAVNGQYSGIGQWSPYAWSEDGGRRYASTPLGASYNEQVTVLMGEGAAGMQQQQGQYDGC